MKTCKHCGAQNIDAARYCIKCGKEVDKTTDGEAAGLSILIIVGSIATIALIGSIIYLFVSGNPIFLAICGCVYFIGGIVKYFKNR